MAQRERYTEAQLTRYYERISLPPHRREYSVRDWSDSRKLDYLSLLQKHQLVQVPWDNLVQHYSWHRGVNVKPQYLFNKIVSNPGRGGYCMEANSFYHHILYTLGYDVYMAGARIYRGNGTYGNWSHVVNIVTIAGVKYLLDGGLGPTGPPRPLSIVDGETATHIPHTESQMRLVYGPIPQYLNQNSKVWIFQHRYDQSRDWVPIYCFPDLEFTMEDIRGMNFVPSMDPASFFTHKVVCVRFTTDKEREDGSPGLSRGEAEMEGEIDGSLSLNQDVLKWRRRGEKVLEISFQTEQDRLDALEKYFGITFLPEDAESIKGTAAAIGAGVPEDL